MTLPVCSVGDMFEGVCSSCDSRTVTGVITTGEFVLLEGKNICVTGSIGVGTCGHTCTAQGQSEVLLVEGKKVVRVGDPVVGTIFGKMITGSDFVNID